ncbi:type 1 glutamine amidotransferase domain-containing protein, partial [Staphylococcus sp. SIMBA_130]
YVPLDPIILGPEMMGAGDWEYYTGHDYMNKFVQTLSPKEVNPSDYQAMYFAGGHGAIWYLRNNKELNYIALIIYNNQVVLS